MSALATMTRALRGLGVPLFRPPRMPDRLPFPLEVWEMYLKDPVMAAEVLLGWKLDTFQKVRLREMWWTPTLIDSSGISSGKTLTVFLFVTLRCTLLPDQWAGVYFPTFATGRDEFWPYFEKTIQQSEFFASQLKPTHGKLGETRHEGSWWMEWKCGNRVVMPSPNWQKDSVNQAGRRFNVLVVDEWLQAILQGDGIAKQLLARVTRASFNKHHPLWCNHIVYLGHAASPSHKGYPTYRETGKAIRDGSTQHARLSFCYRDHSPAFDKFVEHRVIADLKRTLTRDEFNRQVLGIWSADGEGVYPEALVNRCRKAIARVRLRREMGDDHYFLGQDVAIGKSVKADFAASSVLMARRVDREAEANYRYGDSLWWLEYTYGRALRNRTTRQLSGWIHYLDRQFFFDWIMMDPGGGGIATYDEMQQIQQEMNGESFEVVPICDPSDPLQFQKLPKLSYAKRGAEMDPLVNPNFLRGDEGLIDAMHRRFVAAWMGEEIAVPLDAEDLSPATYAALLPAEREALRDLTLMRQELQNVRAKVDKNGQKLTSSKGFTMYESRQKKDRAYSGLYAFWAFQIWLHRTGIGVGAGEDDEDVAAA